MSSGIEHIYLIGSGSSYLAGFTISYLFNNIGSIPTYAVFATEFQYLIKPILNENDCIIGLSQSGETKGVIDSINSGRKLGCLTIAITNYMASNLAKISDISLHLQCSIENSVLSTKTYISELVILSILSLEIAKIKKRITDNEYNTIWEDLTSLPKNIQTHLSKLHREIKSISKNLKTIEFCFYLGSGADYPTVMEGCLKLKEGARFIGHAYPTSEFSHGPLTIVGPNICVISIIPQENDKKKQNIFKILKRIKDLNGIVLVLYSSNEIYDQFDFKIKVPTTNQYLQPINSVIGFQLLTLEIARLRGINCDTPRYLTKITDM
ncbi:MAG: hypothetical protein CEE43_19580 [Promethearchaeota archaeon Loki_b32]|nr:MAG: hypothetical protein CEE43_19580 [Candidatus Lokiarchaeota archaeon Loki_b32]